MHNALKWSDILYKYCGKWGKIFKMCLIILGCYVLNGYLLIKLKVLESSLIFKFASNLFQWFSQGQPGRFKQS